MNIINNHVTKASGAISPTVSLKWPNDVLINGEKVSGVLIEMEKDHLIIGIGCNIGTAPVVVDTGPNGGRQATCLYKHCKPSGPDVNSGASECFRTEIGSGSN